MALAALEKLEEGKKKGNVVHINIYNIYIIYIYNIYIFIINIKNIIYINIYINMFKICMNKYVYLLYYIYSNQNGAILKLR